MNVDHFRADLAAEQEALDAMVADLDPAAWATPTPSPRWTVAHQVAHLAHFDRAAALAIEDPASFRRSAAELLAAAAGGDEAVDDYTLAGYLAKTPTELLAAWRADRAALDSAAASLTDDRRVDWYGPSMSAKSFLTARLMETWAHGQDVVDGLRAVRSDTDRLRHIAQLGFMTRGWSYLNRGLQVPSEPVRVELEAPSGGTWTFGDETAIDVVVGTAVDFCLVVTQRRHVDDTSLVTTPLTRDWMLHAQAFAGPPTDGPGAGTRP